MRLGRFAFLMLAERLTCGRGYRGELPAQIHVTLLNNDFAERPQLPYLSYVVGDAREMGMFPGRHFDICFSNSLMEHLGTADQRRVANEIRRVSKGYFVQTPNRYFPMEPHFLVPGWQFLPVSLRARLLQGRDLGWMKRERDSGASTRSRRIDSFAQRA